MLAPGGRVVATFLDFGEKGHGNVFAATVDGPAG